MKKRTDYHRDYYRENKEQLSERKQQQRDDIEKATSYWRQCFVCGRDLRWLISQVPDSIVEAARTKYEAMLLKEYGAAAVEKMRAVSTWEKG